MWPNLERMLITIKPTWLKSLVMKEAKWDILLPGMIIPAAENAGCCGVQNVKKLRVNIV